MEEGDTDEDKRRHKQRPDETDYLRPYIPGEVKPKPSGATDVFVYEAVFFDGTRTGWWHRMLLRRSQRPRREQTDRGQR